MSNGFVSLLAGDTADEQLLANQGFSDCNDNCFDCDDNTEEDG